MINLTASHYNSQVWKIGVVIPCYKVKASILNVIKGIGPEVSGIYVVDDCCPEGTGAHVRATCVDPRVRVIVHRENLGVGGATISGYVAGRKDGMQIMVKLDGDGQADPRLIPQLVRGIITGKADYTKGNRFYNLEALREMPWLRLFGNSVLSFINKVSSGYWNIMDPTNGFTAIHACALDSLLLGKLDKRYFFESDMLFRLNTIRAVVKEFPMEARYADENSSLNISRVCFTFPFKYFERFLKRLVYNYYLRDFNACSIELLLGIILLVFGTFFGAWHWAQGYHSATFTPVGTIMLAAIPVILGFQSLLGAVHLDVNNVPVEPLQTIAAVEELVLTEEAVDKDLT